MRMIIIDSKQIMEKETAHPYLKNKMNLTDYYGNNLDALYDVLTSIGKKTEFVVLVNKEKNSSYGTKVLQTLKDAAEENPVVQVHEILYP